MFPKLESSIDEILKKDFEIFNSEKSSLMEKIGALYSYITINYKQNKSSNSYQLIKQYINFNIQAIKKENYGYDEMNYDKFIKLIKPLSYDEKLAILKYLISTFNTNLPDYNLDHYLKEIKIIEINKIFHSNKIILYPKALILLSGISTSCLIITLLSVYILTTIILLPSIDNDISLFKVEYENYHNNFHINHILNILSVFTGLSNNIKISPLNIIGLFLLIIGKLIFMLIIINYVYKKITDKIILK